MKLSEAKEQVEREHPELRGADKARAIKALRDQAKAEREDRAPEGKTPEDQQPREDRKLTGLGWLVIALVWWTAVGTIIAIVELFTGPADVPALFWPAEIRPVWLGVLLGLIGFLALAGIYQVLDERGKAHREEGTP
jgi:hypothetical protein